MHCYCTLNGSGTGRTAWRIAMVAFRPYILCHRAPLNAAAADSNVPTVNNDSDPETKARPTIKTADKLAKTR